MVLVPFSYKAPTEPLSFHPVPRPVSLRSEPWAQFRARGFSGLNAPEDTSDAVAALSAAADRMADVMRRLTAEVTTLMSQIGRAHV